MGVGKKGATFSRDLGWSVLTTLMLAILSSYLPPIGMTFPPIRIVPLNNDVHRFLPSRLFPFSSSLSLSPLTLLLSASLPPFSLLLALALHSCPFFYAIHHCSLSSTAIPLSPLSFPLPLSHLRTCPPQCAVTVGLSLRAPQEAVRITCAVPLRASAWKTV